LPRSSMQMSEYRPHICDHFGSLPGRVIACWMRGVKVRFFLKMICRKPSWIDFSGRSGILFCDRNRIAIDPDLFLIAIMIAIAFSKSGSGCAMKIADRF
jgi:hypothetical protein